MDRTTEDVKKGLECCDKQACEECPYDECGDDYRLCVPVLIEDSFELVRQLEAKDVKQSQRIAELEQELAAVKRERDTAVRGLHGDCETCKHYETENCAYCVHDPDAWSAHEDNWEWESVCPENTEVSPDA